MKYKYYIILIVDSLVLQMSYLDIFMIKYNRYHSETFTGGTRTPLKSEVTSKKRAPSAQLKAVYQNAGCTREKLNSLFSFKKPFCKLSIN